MSNPPMHVHTRQQLVDRVPDRWLAQYPPDRPDRNGWNEVTKMLLAIPKPLNPDEVDRIIGNASWTEFKCDQCEQPKEILVRIGDEPDYEATYLDLCEDCLRSALSLFPRLPSPNDDGSSD